ncbi:MAG: nucleotide sugar epimerase [Acidobacteria bacterium]|nr:MAG: nucleotide sugar epimerase [Acidobacteriota bacterium]
MTREKIEKLGTVLVTGGAGAIGSRLVRRLLADGAERVIVVDDLSSGYEWLLPADHRVQLVKRDVCDLTSMNLEADRPLVFHLAAFFANQNSIEHPLDDMHTNGLGTLTALLWARDHQARRVVYASAGCSIAGHGIDAPIREDMPVSLNLDTPYQITKALGEFYCNYFDADVPTVRCRFFNSYGPGELPGPYRNVIPNFIWRALTGEPLVITGTGDETRDFIYVDDLVEGLMKAATVSAARGEAFNLGTGIQTRVQELAEMVIKACHSPSGIEYAPRRLWDKSLRREADIQKARKALDFQVTVGVPEGLERTVAWHKENRVKIESAVRCAS